MEEKCLLEGAILGGVHSCHWPTGFYSPATIVKRRFSLSIDDHLKRHRHRRLCAPGSSAFAGTSNCRVLECDIFQEEALRRLLLCHRPFSGLPPFSRITMARGPTKSLKEKVFQHQRAGVAMVNRCDSWANTSH